MPGPGEGDSSSGKVAELAAMRAVEQEADRVHRVGRPLREGVGAALWRASKALTGASFVLSVTGAPRLASDPSRA